jgi:hypothetical protein
MDLKVPIELQNLSLMEQVRNNQKFDQKSAPDNSNIIRNVLDELLLSNFVCNGHIASQILIGSLFLSEYKRFDLAEIWLRRACNEEISSRSYPLYENHRADAQRKLARVLGVQERNIEAQEAIREAIRAYDRHPALGSLRTGLFDVICNE